MCWDFPALLLQTCNDIFQHLVTFTCLSCLWGGYHNRPTSMHLCMDEFHYFVTYTFVEWLSRQDSLSTHVHGYIPLFGDIQISVHMCMNVFHCWVTFTSLWRGYWDRLPCLHMWNITRTTKHILIKFGTSNFTKNLSNHFHFRWDCTILVTILCVYLRVFLRAVQKNLTNIYQSKKCVKHKL